MTPLVGLHAVSTARFHGVFPKDGVLLGERRGSAQSGRFPQSRGAECEAARFGRRLGNASSSFGSQLEVMTPPSAPKRNHRSRQVQDDGALVAESLAM